MALVTWDGFRTIFVKGVMYCWNDAMDLLFVSICVLMIFQWVVRTVVTSFRVGT